LQGVWAARTWAYLALGRAAALLRLRRPLEEVDVRAAVGQQVALHIPQPFGVHQGGLSAPGALRDGLGRDDLLPPLLLRLLAPVVERDPPLEVLLLLGSRGHRRGLVGGLGCLQRLSNTGQRRLLDLLALDVADEHFRVVRKPLRLVVHDLLVPDELETDVFLRDVVPPDALHAPV